VCPTHFDGYEDAPAIAAQVRRFLDRAEGWVAAAVPTDEPTDAMTVRFARAWESAIAEEAPWFGAAERELLALDVELNAQGLAVAVAAKRAGKA